MTQHACDLCKKTTCWSTRLLVDRLEKAGRSGNMSYSTQGNANSNCVWGQQAYEVSHRGSEAQGGPGKRAAAPPAPSSSLRSTAGLPSDGCVAYTRTVLPLLDSTAYCSSPGPANAPLAPWLVQTALGGDDRDTRVNSQLLAGFFAPALIATCHCKHLPDIPLRCTDKVAKHFPDITESHLCKPSARHGLKGRTVTPANGMARKKMRHESAFWLQTTRLADRPCLLAPLWGSCTTSLTCPVPRLYAASWPPSRRYRCGLKLKRLLTLLQIQTGTAAQHHPSGLELISYLID